MNRDNNLTFSKIRIKRTHIYKGNLFSSKTAPKLLFPEKCALNLLASFY